LPNQILAILAVLAILAIQRQNSSAERKYLIGIARASGGAILFALPMLMTMEMWSLAFYMSGLRLALLLAVLLPTLVALSHFIGFEPTFDVWDDALDALAAFAVGCATSALALLLFGVIGPATPPGELAAMVTLQAVPASLGALLAQSQFGEEAGDRERNPPTGHGAELFTMGIGALFLAFNVAPTEEMILIAQKMSASHVLALAVASVAVMHAFVYGMAFRGQAPRTEGERFVSLFLRFTVAGYGIALLISGYRLWTFGRIDGGPLTQIIAMSVVLGSPAAIGAAAARLLLR
jgi:putative integral membrane protein (TIGR02587 family)